MNSIDFLRKYKYGYSNKDGVHRFEPQFESKLGEMVFVTILLVAIVIIVLITTPLIQSFIAMAITGLIYLTYLVLIGRSKHYSVTIDLTSSTLFLSPKTEFLKDKKFSFEDIRELYSEVVEVANLESPHGSYKIYAKRIKAQIGRKSYTLIEYRNKNQEPEEELQLILDQFNNWIRS